MRNFSFDFFFSHPFIYCTFSEKVVVSANVTEPSPSPFLMISVLCIVSRDSVGQLSYHIQNCPKKAALVQVDENGQLSSGALTGTASLQVTSQESFGVNQTIIVAVKVRCFHLVGKACPLCLRFFHLYPFNIDSSISVKHTHSPEKQGVVCAFLVVM